MVTLTEEPLVLQVGGWSMGLKTFPVEKPKVISWPGLQIRPGN